VAANFAVHQTVALALCARRVRTTSKPPQILVAAVGSLGRRRPTRDPNEQGPGDYHGVCVSQQSASTDGDTLTGVEFSTLPRSTD